MQKMTLMLSSAIVDAYGLVTKHGEELKQDVIGHILKLIIV